MCFFKLEFKPGVGGGFLRAFTSHEIFERNWNRSPGSGLKLVVYFDDDDERLSSEIKDEISSKLASALRALKSRISRICGINELERRTQSH